MTLGNVTVSRLISRTGLMRLASMVPAESDTVHLGKKE